MDTIFQYIKSTIKNILLLLLLLLFLLYIYLYNLTKLFINKTVHSVY